MAVLFQRLSLLLIALALAVAPLRGSFAQFSASPSSAAHHCAQMVQAGDAAAKSSPTKSGGSHDCGHGCKGICCGSACGCAHATAAITVATWFVPLVRTVSKPIPPIGVLAERTLSPPFRPPLSCAV